MCKKEGKRAVRKSGAVCEQYAAHEGGVAVARVVERRAANVLDGIFEF